MLAFMGGAPGEGITVAVVVFIRLAVVGDGGGRRRMVFRHASSRVEVVCSGPAG
jgi:hypothetical protein